MMSVSEKDKKHAELMAGFFSQLGVAFVAGAFLQIVFVSGGSPAAASTLFMAGCR